MKNDSLSVIIPVYNTAPFLRKCIDSILNQTRVPDEIICINDGSTDESGDILREYASKNSRIILIERENKGLVNVRKTGINIARSSYTAYVDSDDWIEPDMYETMMQYVQDDVDIVTSNIYRDYETSTVCEKEDIQPGLYEGNRLTKDIKEKLFATDRFFMRGIQPYLVTKVFKTKLLREYQNQVDDYITVNEDDACAYPCILGANKVYITGKNFYHYNIRTGSMMDSENKNEESGLDRTFGILREAFLENKEIINGKDQYEVYKAFANLLRRQEQSINVKDGLLYPYGRIKEGSKLIIYGAGRFGKGLKKAIEQNSKYKVLAWTDKSGDGKNVVLPGDISKYDYDFVIIGVLLWEISQEIKGELVDMGVEKSKIMTPDSRMVLGKGNK